MLAAVHRAAANAAVLGDSLGRTETCVSSRCQSYHFPPRALTSRHCDHTVYSNSLLAAYVERAPLVLSPRSGLTRATQLLRLNSRKSISARHPAGVTDTSPFGVSIRPSESIELSKSTRHTLQVSFLCLWGQLGMLDASSDGLFSTAGPATLPGLRVRCATRIRARPGG